MSEKIVRIQDDLYEAVNGEWLKSAVIPSDRPTAGGFSELDQGVEKLLMKDFDQFAKGEKYTDIEEVKPAITLYKKYIDIQRRNEDGIKPIQPFLDEIKNIKNIEDFNEKAYKFSLKSLPLPFQYGVEPDMKDARKNSFVILGPSTILPDTTYYAEDNQVGKQLLSVWAAMASKALSFTNLSEDEQKQYIEDALKFDGLVAKKVKSQLEWADYVKNYNPFKVEEVTKAVKPFDFAKFLKDIYGDKLVDEVIVYDPKAIKEMNGYFNEDNFTIYIHWAYIKVLLSASSLLSEELHEISTVFRRTLIGIEKDPILEKQAYQFVSRVYAEPIGIYYGRTYFGEEAKKDIVSLVKQIIETYKHRVKNSQVLEEATKEKAILKLSTIVIKMGYPDYANEVYSKMKVDENLSLVENYLNLQIVLSTNNLDKLFKPVDRNEWAMPGHMVNACYNPSSNDITFPAAILQKPFYGIDQSVSQNLGGIGAVIGHEISHAFDNNGAQFDENGNLFNWWSERDYENFQKLTKDMIEQFDGIAYHGGKVNGELVVSENIADNGGMAVTIEIMHHIEGTSFKDYFENWARVWCMKAKEEYIAFLLTNDVHAPAKLRANIPPRNFAEWYETFGVSDKDEMYIAPEKRLIIW